MSKTLLYHPSRTSNFRTATHLEPFWDKHFKREPIDFARTYNPREYILTVNHLGINETWYEPYIEQGFKLIVDNLWDNPIMVKSNVAGQVLTLRASNWAWFNEALWYIEKGYNQIQLKHNPDKFFFMPMRTKRLHRDQLLTKVEQYLDKSLYSYTSQGITLADDMIVNGDVEQRYINPAWFESTIFSLVAEAMTNSPTFMSEKTFKPMAFEHPFIIWGSVNTLQYLHNAGFETFDHVIDESYDSIIDKTLRLEAIVEQVDQLYKTNCNFNDNISQEKIAHNRAHFYNKNLLDSMFDAEVIQPILNFIE